jgi:glycogenin
MRHAYVTLLCNGDGYLPGVETLGTSLKASGSAVPRILMVTADVSAAARERLAESGWSLREVEPIANPAKDKLLFPRFANVFTKLRAWEQIDIERVVLLDSDTIALQNIDDLFERSFAAGPDFFLPDRFNSGVMVLEPSREVFAQMMKALQGFDSYDGGDQGFLNSFFADWWKMPAENRLPVGYNMPNFIYQFLSGHPTLKQTLEGEAKLLHYLVQKPWQAAATFTGGSEKWWEFYYKTHPEEASDFRKQVHRMQDKAFDRMAALVLGG